MGTFGIMASAETADLHELSSASGCSVSSSSPATGNYSYLLTGGTARARVDFTASATNKWAHAAVRIKLSALPPTFGGVFACFEWGSDQFGLYIETDGVVHIYADGDTGSASGTLGTISANTWYQFELAAQWDGSKITVWGRKEGGTPQSNSKTGSYGSVDEFYGRSGSGFDCRCDDLYVEYDNTAYTDWIGEVKLWNMGPNADSGQAGEDGWSPADNNYSYVDEVPYSDADEVTSGGANNQLWTLTEPYGASITSILKIREIVRLHDIGGYGGPAHIRYYPGTGSPEDSADLTSSLTTSYAYYSFYPSTLPANKTQLDASEAGVKSGHPTKDLYCSVCWVIAAVIEGPGDVTINVPAGVLTLTAYAVTVGLGPLTVAVPAGQLTFTGQVPTVDITDHKTVPVPAGSLSLSGYSPTVDVTEHKTINVPAGSLSCTGYAPTVKLGPLSVNVPAGNLTLTSYAPTVALGPLTVTVPAGSLTLTGYSPAVGLGPLTINVPAGSLSLTGYVPSVGLGPLTVNVPAASLSLTGYAPLVDISADKTITVPAASLTLTGYDPSVALGPLTIGVPAATLTLTGYAPTVALGPLTVSVPAGTLTLSASAPTVKLGPLTVSVPAGALSLSSYAPIVRLGPLTVSVPVGALSLTGYVPTVIVSGDLTIPVPLGQLVLTGYAPNVLVTGGVMERQLAHDLAQESLRIGWVHMRI